MDLCCSDDMSWQLIIANWAAHSHVTVNSSSASLTQKRITFGESHLNEVTWSDMFVAYNGFIVMISHPPNVL